MGNDDGKLAGNPGEEYICLRSGMVTGFPPGDTYVSFEVADSTFHDGPYFIEGIPFVRIPLDAGEHAEVHVVVSISGTPFFGTAAGIFAAAYPLTFHHVDLRAYPFVPVRATFFVAVLGIFHVKAAVFGAGGITIDIVADFFKGAFIPRIIRDQRSGKVEFILKETVCFYRVKSGITRKCIRVEAGM